MAGTNGLKATGGNGTVPATSCDLSVITFNMHGFNQGCTALHDLCESYIYDVIFIQEHWLSPAVLNKILNFNARYVGFGISAMESAVTVGPLRGRPFGGTTILVKEELSKTCSDILTFDRVVTVRINDVLFINSYLPCDNSSSDAINILNEVLANISNTIEESSAEFYIFGGDLNANLALQSVHSNIINDFLSTYHIKPANSVYPTAMNIDYTFANEKLNYYSVIDYLCLSESLLNNVTKYNVLHLAVNHSDHLPLIATITLPMQSSLAKYILSGYEPSYCKLAPCNVSIHKFLRWDKGDTDQYYAMTGQLLYPIYNAVRQSVAVNKVVSNDYIEAVYCKTVDALTTVSDNCITVLPQNALKGWWSSDLSNLKRQSVMSHNIWLNSGKPLNGILFENKNKDKLRYKFAIKKGKLDQNNVVSDKLHEDLVNKDSVSFWKTWKNKICYKLKGKIRLEGNISSEEAATKFATFFETVNTPNSMDFNFLKRNEFMRKLAHYSGDILSSKFDFRAEILAIALDKMEKGKSAGLDNITVEHLIYCHPVIFSLLALLFNAMLRNGFVPAAFGRGITIPIPKNETSQGVHSIESFRGITLSPTISKLFEHCILLMFSDYFVTSPNQFGFKSRLGCPHAIYTVRKTIDFYVQNSSTVNLCFLDITKGFDKINHFMLLLKLLKRRMPVALVKLLYYWYSISVSVVRWENTYSTQYKLSAGIRQGAVLSPTLFSVYVNDMLAKFMNCGCQLCGLSVSAIMYADDLVLLSPSVTELQTMIDICCNELALLDLQINAKKSVAIRIGNRCKNICVHLHAINDTIPWTNEAKYLGITIQSGSKFKCDFDKTKCKYYRAVNAILAKIGNNNNKPVTVSLISSIARPMLMYSIEALSLNKSELASLNHPWTRSFEKLFNTFDKHVIKQCKVYLSMLNIPHYYALKSMSFLNNLSSSPNLLVRTIYVLSGRDDIYRLSKLFECDPENFTKCYKEIIYDQFYQED
jgi:exonuclease III